MLGSILVGSVVLYLASTRAFFPKAFGGQWFHVLFRFKLEALSSKDIPSPGNNVCVCVCSEVHFRVFPLSLL